MADHERPLNRRGERAAEAVASHIAALEARPDQILCSTAVRARQTLAPLLDRLAPAPPTSIEPGLYLASEETLLERLRSLSEETTAALLIGHNDGIWLLARELCGNGSVSAAATIQDKYPTGALAIFEVRIDRWRELSPDRTKLVSFVRPRELVDDSQ